MAGISLTELLSARDVRAGRQSAYLRQYPDKTLVCLTVNLPGPVKKDERSAVIAGAGVAAIRDALSPSLEALFDLETGFEGYFLVEGVPEAVKMRCCHLEDTHPLGRLMDVDVLRLQDGMPVPLGREELGLPGRPCLLCSSPARECMRARRHTRDEIDAKIGNLLINHKNNLGIRF